MTPFERHVRDFGLHYGDCASFDTYGCCEGRLPCDCTAERDALQA